MTRKIFHAVPPCVALALCLSVGVSKATACGLISKGQTIRVRLLDPISSYSSKPGDAVQGELIGASGCDAVSALGTGAVVEGTVKSVQKVGLGFRHARAAIEIDFDEIRGAELASVEIGAQVVEVENAREHVKNGVIRGILSTDAPQDRLTSNLQYVTRWNLESIWMLPAYRALFPILPEPEIYFPAGTDLLLKLREPLDVTSLYAPGQRSDNKGWNAAETQVVDERLLDLPERTKTTQGQDADVINLAFLGSRDEVERAFVASGWHGGVLLNTRTALREIQAFLLVRNYPEGPISRQLFAGVPEDSRWERGLNTLAKRDHLRIWNAGDLPDGQSFWLSASTREIGATLSLRRRQFIHHVSENIDEERERVVRDLMLAGCVGGLHYSPRPFAIGTVENATGDGMRTDGQVAVVQLRSCEGPAFERIGKPRTLAMRPPTKLARYVRTQVLSLRDLWRENAVYGAFAVGRKTVRAVRNRGRKRRETEAEDDAPIATAE